MAQIRRIVRSNPKSQFRQTGAAGGTGFALLADIANQGYDFLLPLAEQEAENKANEDWREYARQQVGSNRVPFATLAEYGGQSLPGFATPRGDGEDIGDAAMQAIGQSSDRELLAKTLQAEAGGEGLEGMLAAGAVINNRVRSGKYGQGLRGVIMKPGQFSAWNKVTGYANGQGGLDMDNITATEDAFRAADMIMSGEYDDITGGATHYYNPAVADPVWGKRGGGDWTQIGNHVFGFADGRPGSGGTEAAPGPTLEQREPVTVTTASGKKEPRLFSPASGEILQVYNATAGIAYMSELDTASQRDLLALSTQFPDDPDGFQEAARAYVDTQVKAAPAMLRASVRQDLEDEVNSRYLGLLDEHHTQVRRRAANSNEAVINRYAQDYEDALALGNDAEAMKARSKLEGALQAREAIPGLAWTRAQSSNVIMKAARDAETTRKANIKAQKKEWKTGFENVIEAAEEERSSAHEGLLDNEAAVNAHPDLAREAFSKTTLRDLMPGFRARTPAERSEIIEKEKSRPVNSDWELDVLDALEDSDKKANKALEDDPIKYAEDYLPEKPPKLPSSIEEAADFTKALSARREYANSMVEARYVSQPTFFSEAEAETLSALVDKSAEPTIKAMAAEAMVSAFGPQASLALEELEADDVTRHVGGLLGAGVGPAVGRKAMMGQALLDEGVVSVPTKANRISSISPEIASALQVPAATQSRILKTATALYAAGARGVDPSSDDAVALMEEAVQEALGMEKTNRGVTGGVQPILGDVALLPPGVSAQRAVSAMKQGVPRVTRGRDEEEGNAAIWGAAGAPSFNGEPLDWSTLQDARLMPVTAPNGDVMTGYYRIEIDGQFDAETADGTLYVFNLMTVLENADVR